ncbi:hypothetical protein GIB67_012612 [Kingdonia uniflora]|uniref:Inositol-pentakisphosphate 2-kinase n=1 Tax=Kingdonia uniflora TaxID=39325 RepID=A0A7J7NEV3_9MAGN|nr:hypothetical protein GIB67_012612 [Kingdonia uniflora]
MELVLEESDAGNWVYKGEGAANIILGGYNGSNPHFVGNVLKFHQGEISFVSDYNPLDLFSGSIGKINKAIKELFTTPQNNFCIFLNGSLIFEGLAGTIDRTRSIVGGEFEDTLEGIIRANRGFHLNSFLQLIVETIMILGVMGHLLDVQKLVLIDIEGAIHAYYNIISQHYKESVFHYIRILSSHASESNLCKDEKRLKEALLISNACGAITVTERGASPHCPIKSYL